MPELPGPPAGYDEEQRRIWYEGATTVAKLQAEQWTIIADQYRKAAEGRLDDDASVGEGDDVDEVVQAAADQSADDAAHDGGCPECGGPLVAGFGGEHCINCGYTPETDPEPTEGDR